MELKLTQKDYDLDQFCPIFVVGHPRSGTTLLATLLGRNSQIASTPETHFMNMVRFNLGSVRNISNDVIIDRLEKTRIRRLDPDRAMLFRELKKRKTITQKSIFRSVLSEYVKRHKKKIVLEKTPVHIRHVDEILKWFPRARIVWIVRDGRACIASLLKVEFAVNDVITLSEQWVRNISYGLYFMRKYPSKIFRLSYEDLVQLPEKELRRLHEKLEIPFEEAQLAHYGPVTTVHQSELEWKKNVFEDIDPARAAAWKESLSAEEIEKIEMVLGGLNQQIGYSRITKSKRRGFLRHAKFRIFYNSISLRISRAGYNFLMGLSVKSRIHPSRVEQTREVAASNCDGKK